MAALDGRVALVTGAGSGIGRASALAFAQSGAAVIVTDVNEAEAIATTSSIVQAGGRAVAAQVDVTAPDAIDAAVELALRTFGRLDCAHNNAGIEQPHAKAADIPADVFDRVLDVNLRAVWRCMAAEIPAMLETGAGSIVNTASVGGLVGVVDTASYGASKHGVIGLTRATAVDYAAQGIRVNAVCPGVVRTGLLQRRIDADPSIEQRYRDAHPIGRLAEPNEIGAVVAWLCSDDASFITGVALPVDGGYTAR